MRTTIFRFVAALIMVLVGMLPLAQSAPLPKAEASSTFITGTIPEVSDRDSIVQVRRRDGSSDPVVLGKPLAVGDVVNVTRPDAIVILHDVARNLRIAVGSTAVGSRYVVPEPATAGLLPSVGAWLWASFVSSETNDRDTMVASRGVGSNCYNVTGETNRPITFSLPILYAKETMIASGDRVLFIPWRGGASPFTLTLFDADTGKVVAETKNIREQCSAYLPRTMLRPGHYTLVLTDARGARLRESNFFAVDTAPGLPLELRQAALPEEARQIYGATWLTTRDHGKWSFEALQRVAALGCSTAAQEWLEPWGGGPECIRQPQ